MESKWSVQVNGAFSPLEDKSDDILTLWVELAPLLPREQMVLHTLLSIWLRNGRLEDTEIEKKLQTREAGMAARATLFKRANSAASVSKRLQRTVRTYHVM